MLRTQRELNCKPVKKNSLSLVEPRLLSVECKREGSLERKSNDQSVDRSSDRVHIHDMKALVPYKQDKFDPLIIQLKFCNLTSNKILVES